MEKRKKTAAQIRATETWEAKNYDRVLIRFPRGTKERIAATGESVNGFVVRAVLAALDDGPRQHDPRQD